MYEFVEIRWKKSDPNLRQEASTWLSLNFRQSVWSVREINIDTKGPRARGEEYYVATYRFEDQNVAFEFKLRFG